MFFFIVGLVGNILGVEFENEDVLVVVISNVLDEEII